MKVCDICSGSRHLSLNAWQHFNDLFSCSRQTEEWKHCACLAGYPWPYDFVGRLIPVADINGRSGS